MKQKGRQHQIRRLPVEVLICLLAAANASSGMVLCVGAHGHVAVEPLAHRHCDGTLHDAHAEPSREHDSGYTAQGRCRPCVDVPLSLGPLEKKSLCDLPPDAVSPVIGELPMVSRNRGAPAASPDGFLLPPDQTALRCTVLQV
ncbi:MAG TPA: hypothetical protein PLU87_18555 [Sedimentisphaerales bacterium]|nr:hypothetical protein [Sedimentisphaerales bacterium]HRS12960.1 hypothetical protein [Sedimentisphaerales bacterium]HRV49615.1 hypothetical protein [Sedimentisphaerales bacterium]